MFINSHKFTNWLFQNIYMINSSHIKLTAILYCCILCCQIFVSSCIAFSFLTKSTIAKIQPKSRIMCYSKKKQNHMFNSAQSFAFATCQSYFSAMAFTFNKYKNSQFHDWKLKWFAFEKRHWCWSLISLFYGPEIFLLGPE